MYIHQLPEWPHFQWDFQALSVPAADVSRRQGHLLGRMGSLGFGLRQEAELRSLTQEVLKSSEIEGDVLEPEQVRSSIARRLGVDIGALTPADRNVDGIVEMMLDATRNCAAPLTRERLLVWQRGLFPSGRSGLKTIRVGEWRDDRGGPMQVVSGPIGKERVHFEAPPAPMLDREMDAFFAWFNGLNGVDAVLRAGLAHLWFVTVHPFDDGNGRIARAIADMALARAERGAQRFYSMSAQIRLERSDYYAQLERAQKGGLDITEWLKWFIGCLDRAIGGAEVMLRDVLAKARFWDMHRSIVFNERQIAILNRLLDGFEGKLTSSKWAKIAKCSTDTALRDIQELVEKGILEKEAAGGRSTNYTLSRKEAGSVQSQ